MTQQSEALRLADALLNQVETNDDWSQEQVVAAAAELRRLHAKNADLEEAVRILSTVVSERNRLEAQRDALLNELRYALKTLENLGYPLAAIERIRAAIKAVEEGK